MFKCCREPAVVRKYLLKLPRVAPSKRAVSTNRVKHVYAIPLWARALLGSVPRLAAFMTFAPTFQRRDLELWIHPCTVRLGSALASQLQPNMESIQVTCIITRPLRAGSDQDNAGTHACPDTRPTTYDGEQERGRTARLFMS